MKNYTLIHVAGFTPQGNYNVKLPDGTDGIIARDDISISIPNGKYDMYLDRYLNAEPLNEYLEGYPRYSSRAYELKLKQKIENDFQLHIRNSYEGEVVYKDWQERYLLVSIAQGVIGILHPNHFAVTYLNNFSRMNLDVGQKIPVTIWNIAPDKIYLDSRAAFGGFSDNIVNLGVKVGAEVEGLIVGECPTNRDKLICSIAPNLSALVDRRADFEIGMLIRLQVLAIDDKRNRIEVLPLKIVQNDCWMSITSYICGEAESWVDSLAFFEENRTRGNYYELEATPSMKFHEASSSFFPREVSPMKRPVVYEQPKGFRHDHPSLAPNPAVPDSPVKQTSQSENKPFWEKSPKAHRHECNPLNHVHEPPMEVQWELDGSDSPFAVNGKDDTVTLIPPGDKSMSYAVFQKAIHEGVLSKKQLIIAEIADNLQFATLNMIAQYSVVVHKNESCLKDLRSMVDLLVNANVLSACTITAEDGTKTTVYYRGRNYTQLCDTYSRYSKLPYNGMAADEIKKRLAVNNLFLMVLNNNRLVKHFERNVVYEGSKLEGGNLYLPYKLFTPEKEGALILEAVRFGDHKALLNKMRACDLRISEAFCVVIACESEADMCRLAAEIRALKLSFDVRITTDMMAHKESCPVVIPATPRNLANRLIHLVASTIGA